MLMGASICCTVDEVDTQFTIFALSALKKQCLIFNEAMNIHDEQFPEDRIQRDLARLKDHSIQQITDGVMDSVKAFSQGMPQSDDITMLILKYYGS